MDLEKFAICPWNPGVPASRQAARPNAVPNRQAFQNGRAAVVKMESNALFPCPKRDAVQVPSWHGLLEAAVANRRCLRHRPAMP